MSDDIHFYEPAHGHGLPHDPFKAIIAPRPIGWVSTVSAEGVVNLAPYSFFNAVGDRPPLLIFASVGRKDSLLNAEATGEFVWNMATRTLADAMNASSAMVGPEVDEFAFAGLATAPSRLVRPPRVADSPAAMECRVTEIQRLKDINGVESDHWLVIGQVIGVHIDRRFLVDGTFDTAAANPIMRAGGLSHYFEVNEATRFEMGRPPRA